MKTCEILLIVLFNLSINVLNLMATDCEIRIPTSCEKRDMDILLGKMPANHITCLIKEGSQLKFDNYQSIYRYWCNKQLFTFIIKPRLFDSNAKISRMSIDVKSLFKYLSTLSYSLEFHSFKGFDLQLFQEDEINRTVYFKNLPSLNCDECLLRFYIGDKQMKSCQDYTDSAINFTTARSIFHLYKNFILLLTLADLTDKICPLAFKNVFISRLDLRGENSYFSQRLIKFSNDTFDDLNTTITELDIYIGNVQVDFSLLHPSVFQQTKSINISSKIKSIHPDLFIVLKSLKTIQFDTLEFRSFIHQQGIDWMKNINRDLNVNLSHQRDVKECFKNKSVVTLRFKQRVSYQGLPIFEVFPEEDFCIYRDFPFNQMVVFLIENPSQYILANIGCTFLWLIQYYNNYNVTRDFDYYKEIEKITNFNSKLLESIPKCNFTHRISICNKSDFHIKPIASFYDFGQSMIWTKSIVNMISYLLCLFGFVTNLLVIITISNKKNEDEFKEFNQYKYMRLNSIISCLFLSIHFLSWLTDCNYPYGIFCSKMRKTLFFQFLKILVGQVLATSLRFMINFLYIEFSFCRLALIGKDPNKLVKSMSEIGIKKYVSISLLISLILSAVKYFSFRINYGRIGYSYPINYDFETITRFSISNQSYFIINMVSDLLNYVLFILIHMIMDIGMVIKLRKTLNDRMVKSKEYNTKEQQEKKEIENESVLNNAISMVILNTVVGILLKIPTCINSIIFMRFIIDRPNLSKKMYVPNRLAFIFFNVCKDAYFCDMFLTLADFLYLLHISIQFFFYKRFDKKFKVAFERKFFGSEELNSAN